MRENKQEKADRKRTELGGLPGGDDSGQHRRRFLSEQRCNVTTYGLNWKGWKRAPVNHSANGAVVGAAAMTCDCKTRPEGIQEARNGMGCNHHL